MYETKGGNALYCNVENTEVLYCLLYLLHFRLLKLCAFCDSSYLMGTEMNEHVRSKHSEEIAKIFHEM